MLNVDGLYVDYGSVNVLKDLSFSAKPGSFIALLGPNGTGKSTLLKAVAGLIPARGSVCLGGIRKLARQQSADAFAYMPQDTGATSSLTVLEVVLLGRLRSLGLQVPGSLREEAEEGLSRFGLQSLGARTLDAVSGGQRQLVYLAQSFFRNPEVLLLDEPTAALDLRHQLIVLDRVAAHCRENGTIAIAAMHDLALASRCADRLICLSAGEIVADGPPADTLTGPLIKDMYGIEADVVHGTGGITHITPLRAVEGAIGGLSSSPQ